MSSPAPSTGSPASASRNGAARARSGCRWLTEGRDLEVETMRRLFLCALVTACFAAMLPVRAQTVDGIEQAWRSWAAKYGQRTGGMVILHAGQPVREVAMGRAVVGEPVPLASLSKAITG